jgi:hypothetical protein
MHSQRYMLKPRSSSSTSSSRTAGRRSRSGSRSRLAETRIHPSTGTRARTAAWSRRCCRRCISTHSCSRIGGLSYSRSGIMGAALAATTRTRREMMAEKRMVVENERVRRGERGGWDLPEMLRRSHPCSTFILAEPVLWSDSKQLRPRT